MKKLLVVAELSIAPGCSFNQMAGGGEALWASKGLGALSPWGAIRQKAKICNIRSAGNL